MDIMCVFWLMVKLDQERRIQWRSVNNNAQQYMYSTLIYMRIYISWAIVECMEKASLSTFLIVIILQKE